ncbi:50S ribosomal protein L24 [bacterium]|nr:MAG: 50S ribosomal protein L24 [bacterium]
MANIKKGDIVKIIAGKNRGKSGKVIMADQKTGRVSVEGLNLYKKHVRPKKQGEKGEVVELARPMSISNVMLVCPDCHKATRVGHRVANETKVRFCKKCQATI